MLNFIEKDILPSLKVEDFKILSTPFKQIVQKLLPVPASVQFVITSSSTSKSKHENTSGSNLVNLSQEPIVAEKPKKTKKEISFILHIEHGVIRIRIWDISPDILLKMSQSWLKDFQHEIIAGLRSEKRSYIDSGTGLYNRRALVCLREIQSHFSSFAFIQVGLPSRSASANFSRFSKIAQLLKTVSPGYLFSCGHSVFGLLFDDGPPDANLASLKLLQKTIKRDGYKKIQVGQARCDHGEDGIRRAWDAMLLAEKRGPFGFCESAQLERDPFALPSAEVLDTLRKQWRGNSKFGLAVVSVGSKKAVVRVNSEIKKIHSAVVSSQGEKNHIFLFFPGADRENLPTKINDLIEGLSEKAGAEIEAVGCATWPTLKYSKTATVVNCLKTLMHCSFYKRGAIVFFDHLSLNISGDYSFEQGDYHAAVQDYRSGLKIDPRNVELLNSLGVALVEYNQFTKAIDCFESALDVVSDHFMALTNLGLAQIARGEKKLAIDNLEKAYNLSSVTNQAGPELLLPLAKLYSEKGQNDKAMDLLQVWKEMPDRSADLMLFRLLSENYLASERFADAIVHCQKALQVYPEDSISMSILGLSYIKQKQGDDVGISLCERALIIDGENADNQCRMASAYFHIGNIEKAQHYVKNCLRLDSKHLDGALLTAKIELVTSKEKQALKRLEALQERVELSPPQKKQIQALLG